jgi:hypothetical protein
MADILFLMQTFSESDVVVSIMVSVKNLMDPSGTLIFHGPMRLAATSSHHGQPTLLHGGRCPWPGPVFLFCWHDFNRSMELSLQLKKVICLES